MSTIVIQSWILKYYFVKFLILILPITYTLHEIIGKKKKCTEEENYLYYMQMYSMDFYGNTEKYIIEKGKFFIIFINWKNVPFKKGENMKILW